MTFMELSKIRHDFMRKIRRFFEDRDFIEIQTPVLVSNPGLEPHLEYFSTQWKPSMQAGLAKNYFLPTSPEYHLKKALGQGLSKVYEISPSFRNGEASREHEPEFLMLEWYRAPGEYQQIADDAFELFSELAKEFSPHAELWGQRRDLRVEDAFQSYAALNLRSALASTDSSSLTREALRLGKASVLPDDDFESCFHKVLLEEIEGRLGFRGLEFLWDYPAQMAALSRRKPSDPLFCERFEIYWRGIELANAFGELTDVIEQRRRFLQDQASRRTLYPGEACPEIDEELLSALAKIPSPAAGIAVGVDRLLQCLLGKESLQSVLLFPKDLAAARRPLT